MGIVETIGLLLSGSAVTEVVRALATLRSKHQDGDTSIILADRTEESARIRHIERIADRALDDFLKAQEVITQLSIAKGSLEMKVEYMTETIGKLRQENVELRESLKRGTTSS